MNLTPQQKQALLKLYPDLAGYLEQKETNDVIKTFIQSIPMVKGDKGDDGYTPIKGKDYFTNEEIHGLAKAIKDGLREEVTPVKGVHYYDGEKGDKGDDYILTERDKKEIANSIEVPIIEKIIEHTETIKEVMPKSIPVEIVTDAVSKKELENEKKNILDGMAKVDGRIKLIDQRWHGGGLSKVSHDNTLSGSGTPSDPLIVTSAGGVSKIIAGTNVTISPSGGTGAVTVNATGSAPASPSGSIQYNNGGVFGGSANATLDATGKITQNTANNSSAIQINSADGSLPKIDMGNGSGDAGFLRLYDNAGNVVTHIENGAASFANGNTGIQDGLADVFNGMYFNGDTNIGIGASVVGNMYLGNFTANTYFVLGADGALSFNGGDGIGGLASQFLLRPTGEISFISPTINFQNTPGFGNTTAYITTSDGSASFANGFILIDSSGNLTATSLIKSGGTSSQFLKADGSVDSTTYQPAGTYPKIVASANLTGKTSTQSSVVTFTTPNDVTHSYRVGAYTSITAISAGTLTVTCTFTDENSTSRTITYFPMGLTTAGLTSTGFTAFAPINIRVKQNTAITVVATFVGVSTTFDVGGTIESLY